MSIIITSDFVLGEGLEIDQALIEQLLSAGLELDIVHENGNYSEWDTDISDYIHYSGVYKPNAQNAYLECKNFPAGRTQFSLAHSDEHTGLFQVIVRYPSDKAAFTAKSKAEQILEAFKIGRKMTYAFQTVSIVSNSRGAGISDGGFYQIVTRSNYRAFVAR